MRALRIVKGCLWCGYAVLWAGGAGGHLLFGSTPATMGWTAPVFLLLATLLVIAADPRDWFALGLSFACGLAAEVVGVATGYPFGTYTYTGALGPTLLGVPLVVAGAWLVVLAWVRQLPLPLWARALAMAAFDLVIDPLAANTLAYWKWRDHGYYYGVPSVNFAGWIAVSVVILFVVRKDPARNVETLTVGCSILLFFALVGLAHGFYAPAAIGLSLGAFGYWRWSSSNVSTRI